MNIERDVSRNDANFSDLVNIAELSVRRVIAMAKQVGFLLNKSAFFSFFSSLLFLLRMNSFITSVVVFFLFTLSSFQLFFFLNSEVNENETKLSNVYDFFLQN